MELKRILARDIRAANEKAVAQYGPDVLVISSGQVNGLTELIVAVDLAPLSPEEADPHVKPEYAQVGKPSGKFDVLLGQTIEQNKRQARERQATKVAKPIVEVAPKPAQAIAAKAKPTAKVAVAAMDESAKRAAEEHDTLRGREIVALVREELNSLRREFKLGQQMAAWQQGGMPLPAAVLPLRDALNDAPIPVALRALLIDNIKDHDNMADAMGALSRQLAHSVEQEQAPTPVSGIHALAGPSGAGKSMMVARLAQNAAQLHGSEKVMVISFQDQRAGAWNQTQLLCAQSGVDSFRATNRRLILIDTPGVQMNERLAEILQVCPEAGLHAVVPADSSGVTLSRIMLKSNLQWQSLMISKLDESHSPWPLIQFLIAEGAQCVVSAGGSSDRVADGLKSSGLQKLINIAMAQLTPSPEALGDDRVEVDSKPATLEPQVKELEAANEPLTHTMGLSRPHWSVEIPQNELHG